MSTDHKIDPKPLPAWLPPLAEQMHAKLREAESVHQQLTALCRQALQNLLADVAAGQVDDRLVRRVLATIHYGWIFGDVMSWGRPQFAPPVVKDLAALKERDLDSGAPADVVEEDAAQLLHALVCNDFPADVAGNLELLCAILDRGELRPNTLWRLAAELDLGAAAEAASR